MEPDTYLNQACEALLFLAAAPLTVAEIAEILSRDPEDIEETLSRLAAETSIDESRGTYIRPIENAYCIVTKPGLIEVVEKFFALQRRTNLSQASYEVLAAVAYNQPVTRAQIEKVRGVNSDSIIVRLMDRGLIETCGTLDAPGRPDLFRVTDKFLLETGIRDVSDLPVIDLMHYGTIEDMQTSLQRAEESQHTEQISIEQWMSHMHEMNEQLVSSAEKKIQIAIDGPSAAGKSTLAKTLAKQLDILYLDTGAMYRAVAFIARERGLDWENQAEIAANIDTILPTIRYEDGRQVTMFEERDISADIRDEVISQGASIVSSYPEVRLSLVSLQREIAESVSCVLDGRDIGSYVLPNAPYKIFLSASVEERARRRYLELIERGIDTDYREVLIGLQERDERDSTRAFAPLEKQEDALGLDTTKLSADEALATVISWLREKGMKV